MKIVLSIFLFLSILSIINCRYCCNDCICEPEFKQYLGWLGFPEDLYQKPYNFYYFKKAERADIKNLKTMNIKESCIENVISKNKKEFIFQMTNDTLMGLSGIEDWERTSKMLSKQLENEISKFEIKECEPIVMINPKTSFQEWKECECRVYIFIEGGKDRIIERAKKIEWEIETRKTIR